ncbi:TIGR03086 family metal-binding protein [Actinomadura sp. HBU206391]|uniref:TIGR03086 family metal-binding protein n=1 Tax=Actinomadura sp. HBU206391 TaxID=2731692 RepID=UPI00164FAE7F|nr:TIGR03086 family metal-binding protein [Actinomadura sp. HBU206391]MBC6461338.1 TIGR03086 family protein [Actinomadura sp. HBU206391]
MEQLNAFDTALTEFDRRVHQVTGEQWDAATPCSDWTVRDLVGHLTAEHLWAPLLLRGATLGEVGDRFDGDVLGDDPVGAWEQAVAESSLAFHRPGALDGSVHTSGGRTPAAEYAWQMTMDLTVHAWDLARGIGADDGMDKNLVATVLAGAESRIGDWQGLGIFDPPVDVAESASVQDRLVALLGRRP